MNHTEELFKHKTKDEMKQINDEIAEHLRVGDAVPTFKKMLKSGEFDEKTGNRLKHLDGYEKLKIMLEGYYIECTNRYLK